MRSSALELTDKRAIVTGSSSGIGRALAEALTARGAHVVLASRREERLHEAADEIHSRHPDAPKPLVIPCDVTDADSVAALIQSCRDQLDGVDILINNAGVGVYGANERTPLEDMRWTMETNFFAPVRCMLAVLPLMREQGSGLIVNISTVAAMHGVPYMGSYGASKAALTNFSQSLRAELSNTDIRILVVYPGYTQTDFFAKEKHVGGIVRGIERGRFELLLTFQGRFLKMGDALAPYLIHPAMRKLADQLREE